MCTPEAQTYFSDDRFDDCGIGDGDRLLRSCRSPVQIVPCKVHGLKVSDQAFQKKKGEAGASVDLECLLAKDGKGWEDRFGAMPDTLAMIAVTAADVRLVKGGAAWTPKPEQPELHPAAAAAENPYHGEIIGEISRPDIRKLGRGATVLRADF